jgi:hypothetical protein
MAASFRAQLPSRMWQRMAALIRENLGATVLFVAESLVVHCGRWINRYPVANCKTRIDLTLPDSQR